MLSHFNHVLHFYHFIALITQVTGTVYCVNVWANRAAVEDIRYSCLQIQDMHAVNGTTVHKMRNLEINQVLAAYENSGDIQRKILQQPQRPDCTAVYTDSDMWVLMAFVIQHHALHHLV